MNDYLLNLYHQLPAPLRSVAASMRGYYLHWQRYGPETERIVQETFEREHWSPEKMREYQRQRLAQILETAATRVPYYRDLWRARRRAGDHRSWTELENWPILEKQVLRSQPERLVADGYDLNDLVHQQTSGTTGTPLHLWFTRRTLRTWYGMHEARARRWYGVSDGDRWAILGGQLICPAEARQPPFWVWNRGMRQLYLSVYHLSRKTIPAYLDALSRYRIRYLLGYSSALYQLAEVAVADRRTDLTMKVAITNAEPLIPYQRSLIAEAFRCPVRETYGLSELVVMANECERGALHLWPSVGIVEVMDDGKLMPPGCSGELICTGLLSESMPLIRYRTGDRGALAPPDQRCACGRALPILASLDGRQDDLIITRDGRALCHLDLIFKGDLPIHEAQIIQEDLDTIRIRYVPASGYTPSAGETMKRRVRQRVGEVKVILDRVDTIPRGPNGKFRVLISKAKRPTGSRAMPRSG
ncbi:MAG: phenylacetate--CoA ligase family protein [Bryobacteraceae bacterium]